MEIKIREKYSFQMPICGIYQISCKINKKIYIGQSKNISARVMEHFKNLREQKNDSEIQYDYDRWGMDAFEWEILQECDPSDLIDLERGYISKHSGTARLYNLLVYDEPYRVRKNDLQTGRAGLGPVVYYGDVDAYKTAFLAQHEIIRSWRKIADQYGIYPNMARMISRGYDPGNRIRKILRLPMKDKFEVCPKCKLPMRKGHQCQAKKRNRLSINLDDPGSAARSIMKYMGRDKAEELIEMLMEEQINVLNEGR